jgi:hypothetical protein
MVFWFNLASGIFAILAAFAWIQSTWTKEYPTDSPEPRPPGSSYPAPQLAMGRDKKGRQYELFATLRLQSKWNGRAALLAAVAAFCQAAATMTPPLCKAVAAFMPFLSTP